MHHLITHYLRFTIALVVTVTLLSSSIPVVHAQAAPQITSVTPDSAAIGQRIIITGSGFTSFNTVSFTGDSSATASAASGTGQTSVAFIPRRLPEGSYQLAIQTSRGVTSNSVSFTITEGATFPGPNPTPPPGSVELTITSLSPTRLSASAKRPTSVNSGQRVRIEGTGFGNFSTVNLEGPVSATSGAASGFGTLAFFTLPRSLPTGSYNVSINSRGQESNTVSLDVTNTSPEPTPSPSPAPTPTSGPCFFGIFFCSPDALTYTALGDSLAIGATASRGYVPRYRSHIQDATGDTVSLNNLGRSGWQSSQLRTALESDPKFRNAVQEAEYLTFNIGGNDLRRARELYQARTCGGSDNQQCLRDAVTKFTANWDAIVAHIIQHRQNTSTAIRTIDIYYPFVNEDRARDTWHNDGGQNDYDELRPYVAAINVHVRNSAANNGIALARIADTFNGPNFTEDPSDKGFISFDGFHPNDTGHRIIADQLRQLGIPTNISATNTSE